MGNIELKVKHIEMVQSIIAKMTQNSFLIKGWSITLVAAIFAINSSKNTTPYFPVIAFIPALMFWYLDGFYLWQERLFRKLHESIAREIAQNIANRENIFDMNTKAYENQIGGIFKAMFSRSMLPFHLTILLIVVVVSAISLWDKISGGS